MSGINGFVVNQVYKLADDMETTVRKLKEEMQCMLTGNILPFWMNHMVDSEYGGFYGRISGTGERVFPELLRALF